MTKMLKDHKGNDMMSTQDIIRTEFESRKTKGNWQAVYAELHKLLATPQYRMMRAGNTLCMYHNNGNKTATIYLFNADPLDKLIENMKEGFAAFKKAGFTALYTETERPAMVKLIEKTGANSVTVKTTEKNKNGQYSYYTHIEL